VALTRPEPSELVLAGDFGTTFLRARKRTFEHLARI